LGEYVVLDIGYAVIREFDTVEEAEAFVAEANGTDTETVRRDTEERARMLHQYRESLVHGRRENTGGAAP
jgi:hypothetical protein